MEIDTMGKVAVAATVENLEDLYRVKQGTLDARSVRRIDVPDALIDTGATMLALPTRLIDQLGLERYRASRVRTATGTAEVAVCEPVRLTVQGRQCTVEVTEIADGCSVLIGQVPLEQLDFVVDPVARRLIGNPEHGGEHMYDLF